MGKRGSPKTGGRQKGTPNKNNQTFRQILAAFDDGKGFEPVSEALRLYTLIHADNPLMAVKILQIMIDRLYPTLKAVEMKGSMVMEALRLDVNGVPYEFSSSEPSD